MIAKVLDVGIILNRVNIYIIISTITFGMKIMALEMPEELANLEANGGIFCGMDAAAAFRYCGQQLVIWL